MGGKKREKKKKREKINKLLSNLLSKKHYPWNAVKQMYIIMQLIFIQKGVCVNKVEVRVRFNKATNSLENQDFLRLQLSVCMR